MLMLVLKILESSGGIDELLGGRQAQRNGVESEVPSEQILGEVVPLKPGEVDRPAFQHQPSHLPLLVQHHARATVLPRQALDGAQHRTRDYQIEVRAGGQSVQQTVANRSANQNRPFR